jgi:hypothetical protein
MIAFMHASDKGDLYNFRLIDPASRLESRDVSRLLVVADDVSATLVALNCLLIASLFPVF